MPSVRRSTGRAVTPVRQPEVAAAKQTQLTAPPMAAFPLPPGLTIESEEAFESLPARLGIGDATAPFETLAAPPWRSFDARLRAEAGIEDRTSPFPPVEPVGVAWGNEPYAGRPDDADHRIVRALRPRLAAGIFEQEAVFAAFPEVVRADQIEAVQRLLDEPDVFVVADPGCGMEPVVALGLRELFRTGQIERALLLTTHEGLGTWSRTLRNWAGELPLSQGVAEGRAGAWPEAARVWLLEPEAIAEALRASVSAGSTLGCDVVIVAGYVALRRRGFDPTSLAALPTARRWVFAGGPPPEAEDWRLLHRYFHPDWAGPAALADIQERLRRQTLRQTKTAVQDELPRRSRIELWFDLEGEQRAAYQMALAEERLRLERLGGAVNRTHLAAALSQLKRILAFQPRTLDGVKPRALVDLTEEILAGGSKLIVVAPPGDETPVDLLALLDAYGAVRLDSTAGSEEQGAAIGAFRGRAGKRVLIADSEARGDGEPFHDATYLVHFSHDWNPAHRRRVEQRLFPDLGPGPALTIYEFWTSGTVEERYHRLLEAQGLLARDVALETRPKDIEERLRLQDWTRQVFEVGSPEAPRVGRVGGTGQLPGTGDLRRAWSSFDDEGLAAATESLLRALGFTQIERVGPPHDTGCDFVAWLTSAAGAQRVFIRCLRQDTPIEVYEGETILDELKDRPDCVGAYLIATVEFHPVCRELADASGGRLALVDGSEFFRHLRVLGLVE